VGQEHPLGRPRVDSTAPGSTPVPSSSSSPRSPPKRRTPPQGPRLRPSPTPRQANSYATPSTKSPWSSPTTPASSDSPAPTEGTIRGFSAVNLLLVDEAAQVADELYHAVRPMLVASRGDLWLMSTRFARRGFFYHEWTEAGPHWQRISVPATKCPRLTPKILEELRLSLGDHASQREFLCQTETTSPPCSPTKSSRKPSPTESSPSSTTRS
jgi:hypothetical protein